MKKTLFIIWALLLVGLLVSCTPPATLPPEVKAPAPEKVKPPIKAEWEQNWESTLAAAKREGSVALYSIWMPNVRIAVTQGFKDKYGIDVEFTPFGRGSDLLVKVQAQQRAGLYNADVFGVGNTTLLVTMKPVGLLGSLKPLLILPEVLDPKAWRMGEVPFGDKEAMSVSMIGVIQRTIVHNTNLLKEGEITSHKDLLKPQYKGKITMEDPSITGIGNAMLTHLGYRLWGEEVAIDFLRRLIKDQEMEIQRDRRIHLESVARGKYAIALAPLPDLVSEFINLKAPIKIAIVEEDNWVSAGAGAIGVPTTFAHPNAAIIFVNWLLSKEGQTMLAKTWGNPSTRADISTEGMDPLLIPMPGKKYYTESSDALEARGRWLELAAKIMRETIK